MVSSLTGTVPIVNAANFSHATTFLDALTNSHLHVPPPHPDLVMNDSRGVASESRDTRRQPIANLAILILLGMLGNRADRRRRTGAHAVLPRPQPVAVIFPPAVVIRVTRLTQRHGARARSQASVFEELPLALLEVEDAKVVREAVEFGVARVPPVGGDAARAQSVAASNDYDVFDGGSDACSELFISGFLVGLLADAVDAAFIRCDEAEVSDLASEHGAANET
mmetsp:Transcript_7230/g.11756  ORF Transcript_7230/g.11756 Transcript_7230/m.11756 type:complete len:224 (-) Transcript_7230:772-1443(-)